MNPLVSYLYYVISRKISRNGNMTFLAFFAQVVLSALFASAIAAPAAHTVAIAGAPVVAAHAAPIAAAHPVAYAHAPLAIEAPCKF